jgi:hypothetical protein
MMSLDGAGLLRAQWNYFGNFSFRFRDVRIHAVQPESDQRVTDAQKDLLIGSRVYVHNGLLIDTNPEG